MRGAWAAFVERFPPRALEDLKGNLMILAAREIGYCQRMTSTLGLKDGTALEHGLAIRQRSERRPGEIHAFERQPAGRFIKMEDRPFARLEEMRWSYQHPGRSDQIALG